MKDLVKLSESHGLRELHPEVTILNNKTRKTAC